MDRLYVRRGCGACAMLKQALQGNPQLLRGVIVRDIDTDMGAGLEYMMAQFRDGRVPLLHLQTGRDIVGAQAIYQYLQQSRG